MVSNAAALKLAQEYVKAVRALGVPVKHAFLFGSYARKQQRPDSDIDVALVADGFIGVAAVDKDPFRRLHVLPEYWAIETHTFPTQRLEMQDPFFQEILRTGIRLI
jgi:uncharacterized protein